MSTKQSRWTLIGIGIFLVAITWAVFGQTFRHQFINYDDPLYVLDNAHVRAGLTWRGIAWAFTHVHSQNWHPLTSISHMLDCQLFGVNPGAHHLVNVFFHSAAALLLFQAPSSLLAPYKPIAKRHVSSVVFIFLPGGFLLYHTLRSGLYLTVLYTLSMKPVFFNSVTKLSS